MAQKATYRLEHFLAQKIAEGDEKGERDDPWESEPNIEKQEGPILQSTHPWRQSTSKLTAWYDLAGLA